MKKKILCLTAALTLCCSMLAGTAWASEVAVYPDAAQSTASAAQTLSVQGLSELSAGTTTVSVEGTYLEADARNMLTLINEFRTGSDAWYWDSDNSTKTYATGLSTLTYDKNLEDIAKQRAMEIALSFLHTRPDGTSCFTAYTGHGTFSSKGENIAAGYSTTQSAFIGWREDDYDYDGQGHRRNMLSDYYNAVGIACVQVNGIKWWVQEFGYTSSIDTSYTTAKTYTASVNVNVLDSTVSSCTLDAGALSDLPLIGTGSSATLPSLSFTGLALTGTWYYAGTFKGQVVANWSSADTTQITCANGKATAQIDFPYTQLTATVFGTTKSLNAGFDLSGACSDYAPGLKILSVPDSALASGKVLKYNGTQLLWAPASMGSTNMGSWVMVLPSSQSISKAQLSLSTGTKSIVARPGTTGTSGALPGDINQSGKVNVVDAQVAYDAAMGKYAYSALSAEAWLMADVNGDNALDSADAQAIQSSTFRGW